MADMGASSCELLALTAKAIFPMVMQCGIQRRERVAGEVGTKLGQIAQESFPGYEIDTDTEKAAECLLSTLLLICTWPKAAGASITPQETYSHVKWLSKDENKEALKSSVFNFFAKTHGSTFDVKNQCDHFLAKLNEGNQNTSTSEPIMQGSKVPAPTDYPGHVNRNLFEVLYQHAICTPAHFPNGDSGMTVEIGVDGEYIQELLHPTRLHLGRLVQAQGPHAQFEVLISPIDNSYWQDFCVDIPTQTRSRQRNVTFEDMASTNMMDAGEDSQYPDRITKGFFCEVLQAQIHARVEMQLVQDVGLISLPQPMPLERFLCPGQGLPLSIVLERYKMTDKDRIILSHAIAHSFWEFYASELMRTRWVSQNIWFMHERDDQDRPKDGLALRAYMSLGFSDHERTPEYLNGLVTHPFPHILALGVILLEIGLGRPFKSMLNLQLSSRLNRDHGAAKQLLNELEKGSWARSTHKTIFSTVVANCLDPKIFTILPDPRKKSAKSTEGESISINATEQLFGEPEINERRRRVYDRVVEPLSRLVHTAFKRDPQFVSYLSKCKDSEGLDKQFYPQIASFHAGKDVIPHQWLSNLTHISRHIMHLRRQKPLENFTPVKIAIIDTGYDALMPFFKVSGRASCIKGWKDFVDCHEDSMGTTGKDEYGHGSLMARLSMESAPLAEIYVARVSRNTDELAVNTGNITEAIRWAGLDKRVDIISMSFGFSKDIENISLAIQDVERDHNVVFLASAGNNAAHQRETFPARHQSVISIRATNCHGTFSHTNPPIIDRGINSVLGTFGDNLPDQIHREMECRFGSHICQPGSSISTAVAAGIAASTIAYAEVLSAVLPIPTSQSPVPSLKKRDGMLRMLEKMAPEQTGHHKFVSPIWFWSEKADAWKAWAAMYDSVSEVNPRRN